MQNRLSIRAATNVHLYTRQRAKVGPTFDDSHVLPTPLRLTYLCAVDHSGIFCATIMFASVASQWLVVMATEEEINSLICCTIAQSLRYLNVFGKAHMCDGHDKVTLGQVPEMTCACTSSINRGRDRTSGKLTTN